jgi:hypothetical protein
MTQSDATVWAPDTEGSRRAPGILFRVGWWVLVGLTALLVANHALGLLTFATSDEERALFLIFLAFGVLSLVVLLIPYRRLERWSWWATWIPVVAIASPLVLFPFDEIVMFYAGFAVVMAAAQLATLRAVGLRRSA